MEKHPSLPVSTGQMVRFRPRSKQGQKHTLVAGFREVIALTPVQDNDRESRRVWRRVCDPPGRVKDRPHTLQRLRICRTVSKIL